MSAPYFFKPRPGLTVREIAALTGAEPGSGAELDRRVTGIAALDRATPHDLVFIDSPKYADLAAATAAGVCLAGERLAARVPARVSVLQAREPYRAFLDVAPALLPDALRPSSLIQSRGVAARGVVHPTAR